MYATCKHSAMFEQKRNLHCCKQSLLMLHLEPIMQVPTMNMVMNSITKYTQCSNQTEIYSIAAYQSLTYFVESMYSYQQKLDYKQELHRARLYNIPYPQILSTLSLTVKELKVPGIKHFWKTWGRGKIDVPESKLMAVIQSVHDSFGLFLAAKRVGDPDVDIRTEQQLYNIENKAYSAHQLIVY